MALYYSKEGLYREVAKLKEFLGLDSTSYGIDLTTILKEKGILIENLDFKTRHLRGMAVVGKGSNEDIILLNSNRNSIERNFDCGHEMIHLSLHRELNQKTFNCYDRILPNQNSFTEWQANEGAAEFFVPYKILLPMIKNYNISLDTYTTIDQFKHELETIFKVPSAVIAYRLENLSYEISQYQSGIALENIEILSKKKQIERKIHTISLNEIADNDFFECAHNW